MEIITPHITITDTKKVLHFTLFQMDDTHKVTLFARKCLRGSTAGSPTLLLYSTFPRNLLREEKETEKVSETVNCEVVNTTSLSLSLCSCSVSVSVINQNCQKTGHFQADPQFFKADAPFLAYFLLQDLCSPTSFAYLIFLSCDHNNQNGV